MPAATPKPWGDWTAEELRLSNKILRAFPSSPTQKALKKQLEEMQIERRIAAIAAR